MVSTEKYCDRKTIEDASMLTDHELLEMSLSKLSKGLSFTTSSELTLSTYLRWLEIHRQCSSQLPSQWQNTVIQWAQSLLSRGFHESDLVNEVNRWKEYHGPFYIYDNRYPPTSRDIAKAFDDLSRAREQDKIKRQEDEYFSTPGPSSREIYHEKADRKANKDGYTGLPPGDYLCNRCQKKGHFVQVCPTNMDPAYDTYPDIDYVCKCCNARGMHYRSLCPKNMDPASLTQQRKHKDRGTQAMERFNLRPRGAENENPYGSSKWPQGDREFGQLSQTRVSSRYSSRNYEVGPIKTTANRERLQEIDNLATRLLKEELVDVAEIDGQGTKLFESSNKQHGKRPLSDLNRGSSPSSLSSKQTKFHRTSDTREHFNDLAQNILEGMRAEEITNAVNELLREGARYMDDGTNDWKIEHLNPNEIPIDEDDQGSYNSPVYVAEHTTTQDTMNVAGSYGRIPYRPAGSTNPSKDFSDNLDSKFWTAPTPSGARNKNYSKFVQRHIRKRPELAELVNKIKKRPTAVDMWEADDQKQNQPLATAQPKESESLGCPRTEWDIFRLRTSSQGVRSCRPAGYPQFDGACDERTDQDTESIMQSNSRASVLSYGKNALNKVKGATISFKELSMLRFGRSDAQASNHTTSPGTSTVQTALLSTPVEKTEETNQVSQTMHKTSLKLKNEGHEGTAVENIQISQARTHSTARPTTKPVNMKIIYNSTRVRIPQDPDSSRSTGEFQSIVRNIIEQSKRENLKRFTETLNVPTTIPEEAASTISQTLLEQIGPYVNLVDVHNPQAPEAPDPTGNKPIEKAALLEEKIDRAQAGFIQQAKGKLMKMRVKDDLRRFSQSLKLSTPVPEEIIKMLKTPPTTKDHQAEPEKSTAILDTTVAAQVPGEDDKAGVNNAQENSKEEAT